MRLVPLDEAGVEAVAAAARFGAAPGEVMPPVLDGLAAGDSPAWDDVLVDRYCRWLLDRDALAARRTFAVVRDGVVVGSIRLDDADPGAVRPELLGPDQVVGRVAETGMWLVRPARGGGVGTAALSLLVDVAVQEGLDAVQADTRASNAAARGALLRLGAVLHLDGDDVHTLVPVRTRR